MIISKYYTFIQNKSFLDLNTYQQIKNSKLHNSNKSNKFIPIIIDYVNKNEGCSLKNIKNEINNSLSSSTICRLLKNNNITKKKIINNTIYKSIEDIDKDRIKFVKDLTKDQFYNLISTDESHFNINQVKNYGYSKKGNIIIKCRKHKRTKESRTLIPIISTDGILKYNIYNKTVNGEDYLNFIKSNVDILKNRTIILDNARIHHYNKVKQFAIENNITLLFNAPYSPIFNPIELIFNTIKKNFKELNHDNIEDDINNAIKEAYNIKIQKLYDHCWEHIIKYKNTIMI